MKSIIKFFICIIIFTSFGSCTKPGTGGSTTVVCYLKHHIMLIANDSIQPNVVYVKFGAKDLPADPTNDYDVKFTGQPGKDHVHAENLKPGQYYFYAVGFDTSISQVVKGGLSVKIKGGDKGKEIDLNIPVTE